MEEIEKTWPGWEIVRKIGSGSFGAVYEIQRDVFGRTEKAALKKISIPESQEEIDELYNDGYDEESITTHFKEHLGELVREYSLMLDMKGHTNVVYCDDVKYVQHEDGIGWDIYIKMELLTPLIKAVGNVYDETQTVRLGIDLCNALILCKQENIVHRDIKPQNIFVSRTGDYKLGDFGVAKVSDKTASGTKVGTFDYMAPEVFRGQAYGSGADIYSLGIVLYWMMNQKRTPFLPLPPQIPSASAREEARNRRFQGETLPEPVNGSDELKRIVLKACAYDPKERYHSAAEMQEDLKKLDAGAAIVPPVVMAAEEYAPTEKIYPEEGTVNIFGSQKVPVQEPTEEKTEYIRDEKTEYIPRQPQPEKPAEEKKKKNWLFPVIAGILVVAIILLLLRSCGGSPADTGETGGNTLGTAQNSEATGESTQKSTEEPNQESTEQPTEESAESTETEGTTPSQTQPGHTHTWTAATCTIPKTCTACGATEGAAAGHKWTEATYTEPKTCTVCKLTEGIPKIRIIAVIAKGETHAFWQAVRAGAEAAGEEAGYNVTFRGPTAESEEYVASQREMVQAALNNKDTKALVLATIGTGFADELIQAYDKGLPVVEFDSGLYSGGADITPGKDPTIGGVATDNYASGGVAAENLYKYLKKQGVLTNGYKVGVIQHDSTSTGIDRAEGFIEKIEELAKADGITLDINRQVKANNAGEYRLGLTALADWGAQSIFMTNEGVVNEVFPEISDNAATYKDILFCGFDAGTNQYNWMKDAGANYALLVGSVTQDSYSIGYQAVKMAIAKLEGKTVGDVGIAGVWYNAENIDELKNRNVFWMG